MAPLYVATEHLATAAVEKREEMVEVVVARDQGVRPDINMENLSKMTPVFLQVKQPPLPPVTPPR